ncbi:MAG: peptidase M64 [Melioribacteraceae bacterium]|nr:peptidase M64 [Melioribacteraceae bacterium]
MKYTLLAIILISSSLFAQIKFEDYFEDKSLRVDYIHSGSADAEYYSLDEVREEPVWSGSKTNLIDEFGYGQCYAKLYNIKNNELIFSKGYCSLFNEYITTSKGKSVVQSFSETVVMPYPKDSCRLELFSRDRENIFHKKFEYVIDPSSYLIKKGNSNSYQNFKVHYSGEASKCLDVVFIPEGFSKNEIEKFHEECERFAGYLLNNSPFDSYKNKINIWGIDAYTNDSGVDIPKDNVWKNSLVGTSYYTFDSERYLMTDENKVLRDVASNAPYDQIYILVNSDKYGGGGIYNFYNVCIVDNKSAEKVFLHEFGHGLAGLADEYFYDNAYNEFYNLDVEPWEENITTLVNFEKKWKDLVNENVSVPTTDTAGNSDIIGVFEGGGYSKNGIYRSTKNSIMLTLKDQEFNEVSKRTIRKIMEFYTN